MNILSICDNPDVLQVMRIINIVITVIKIAVPILLIIFIMVELVGAVADEEKFKKVTSGAVKKFIAALLIFLIPTFVQVIVVNVVGSNETNEEYKNCLKDLSVEQINKIYEKTTDVMILLEYMAGKGNEVGTSIDELKSIIDKINDKDRVGVCIDTCHMNDSGVDISKFNEFLDEFDSKIGINKIKCVHVNDSLNPIGSHKDRHANIGYGTIGFDNLINVVYNDRLEGIPFILETPYINRNNKDAYAPYKMEIESIRNKKFTDFIQ